MKPHEFVRAIPGVAVLLVLLNWVTLASASGLGVSPIRIHLSDTSPTAALTLENNGTTPSVVQMQVMRWLADGDRDRYEPTYEIVASPPIATIEPGQTQIVRVGLSRDVEPDRELTYRLYIEEVPPPPKPNHQGLQVALRIGVPLFVAPEQRAGPQLSWRAKTLAGGGLSLHVINQGNAHLRLMGFRLRSAKSGRLLTEQQSVGYLLPGQSRQWSLPLQKGLAEKRLLLSVTADPGVADVELELEQP